MISFLNWNMRGAGKAAQRRRIKKLIRMNDVCMVSIQEPKVEVNKLQNFANFLGLSHYVFNPLAERKMWLLWDDRVTVQVVAQHE